MTRSTDRTTCSRQRLNGARAHFTVAMLSVLTVLLAGSASAHAQSTAAPRDPPLQAGARIRVKPSTEWTNLTRSTPRVGTLRALTSDSLWVAWTDGGTTTLPLTSVARLEASEGQQHYLGRGLLIGLLAGSGTAAIIGAASHDDSACGESGCFLEFGRGFYAAVGAAVGGGIGLVAGGIVGATGRREVWRRVRLDALASRVSVIPLPAARGIAVRWSIGR